MSWSHLLGSLCRRLYYTTMEGSSLFLPLEILLLKLHEVKVIVYNCLLLKMLLQLEVIEQLLMLSVLREVYP